MNKTALNNFAIWARVKLIEQVKQKAFEYGIDENGYGEERATVINGTLLTAGEAEQRAELVSQIKRKGFNQVAEEVAYTWFNRFVALRYMEVNGYLPTRVRVFSNESGEFDPEILRQAASVEIEGLDKVRIYDYLDTQDNEGLFKYLIIAQCNALNKNLPGMFERINNYTELLFPNNLLREDSVIGRMISDIPEDDWTDAVQIIGWLYQYYNSELKDETYAALAKNVKLTKEKIPAVTQLFTPDWIVRYMVENSLGRLWYEGHPDETLKSNWKYYLDEAQQEEAVEKQLEEIRAEYAEINPEEIKVIDPCMGSGHILVYAFDVLMQIYVSQGWNERDAAKLIVENNLYGIDIDDRAYQLAYFAVMMKARSYSRRILNGDVKCNLCGMVETDSFNRDYLKLFGELEETAKRLADEFIDAKEYGSIMSVKASAEDIENLIAKYSEIKDTVYDNIFDCARQTGLITEFEPVLRQAKALTQKYDVVVTNPPYMTPTPKQKPFVEKNYPDSKSDLFAVFIEKNLTMTRKYGFSSIVTMQSWMFLSSFEKMRSRIVAALDITNLMHMDNMVMHIAFGTAVAIIRNSFVKNYKGTYNQVLNKNIIDENGEEKPFEFPVKGNRFSQISTDNFSKIPGSPVAYWVSEKLYRVYNIAKPISETVSPKQGTSTGDNNAFLRLWHEVLLQNINFLHIKGSTDYSRRWYPATKGGDYRKYYGNNEYLIDWQNDGQRIEAHKGSAIRNRDANFREALTWTGVSSKALGIRYNPPGFVFTISGKSIVGSHENLIYTLGFLCSKISNYILQVTSPTMSYEVGYICGLPLIESKNNLQTINELVDRNIGISKSDWDSFETSWDFKKSPLL